MPIGASVGVGGQPLARLLAPSGVGNYLKSAAADPFADFSLTADTSSQQMAPQAANTKFEFRVITSNSHIQILENGSMLIKDVELSDESRYICQAFNGINPSLSEMIELTVLSPAQFEVNYETVSVKRDSMIKFNCAPKGDQPMQIEWRKEANLLVPATSTQPQQQQQQSKYSEIVHFVAAPAAAAAAASPSNTSEEAQSSAVLLPPPTLTKHNNLVVQPQQQQQQQQDKNSSSLSDDSLTAAAAGMRSSELLISYADRSDSATFICVARNAYGKDQLQYRLLVQEPPDTPTRVHAQSVQSSSAKVSWQAPFDGNLPLSHFVLEYRKVATAASSSTAGAGSHGEWSRLIVSTGGSSSSKSTLSQQPVVMVESAPGGATSESHLFSVVLRSLSAKSTYHIRVAAANALGQSAYSSHLSVVTAEEAPNQRANDVRTQPVSSSSIRVLWRSPALIDEQAPIKAYYVSHRKLEVAQQQQQQEQNTWIATFSVSATNTTPTEQDAYLFGGGGSGLNPQQQQQQRTTTAGAGLNYELLVGGLEKNTKYELRVQAYNSMGVGPATEVVGQTLKFDKPAQPALELVAVRRQSLELKWKLFDSSQPLMGFSIFYKCEYDDWQEIQLGAIYRYVIENLRCGNKYQIYLSAFNVVGRSEPSDVLSVRTEGTVPVAPDKSDFIRSNISEIVLDMSQWQSGGCAISSFMIQFKRLHESNWFILSEGQTGPFANSDKITIPDLTPATWYKLLVSALNEAGTTNAEYLFSTLTVDGAQIAPIYHSSSDASFEQQHRSGLIAGHAHQSLGRSVWNAIAQLFSFQQDNNSNRAKQSVKSEQQAALLLPMSSMLLLLLLVVLSLGLYMFNRQRSASAQPARRNGTHASCAGAIAHSSSSSSQLKCAVNQQQQQHQQVSMCSSHLQQQAQLGADYGKSAFQQTPNYANNLLQADEQQQSMLDSLAGMQSMQTNNNQQQLHSPLTLRHQHHALKLLSSGQNMTFSTVAPAPASNCTSSSMSTHSTNCFEPSSSSTNSAQTATSSGARAKLQLIDESSMILSSALENYPLDGAADTQQQQQQFQYLYGTSGAALNQQLSSPVRQVNMQLGPTNASGGGIYLPNQADFLVASTTEPMEPASSNLIDVNNFNALLINSQEQQQSNGSRQLYSSSANQRMLSSSFASGSDLIQRQQYQLQQDQHQQQQLQQSSEEPIYQRLDMKFQTYGAKQAQQQQQQKSHTLRFNNTHFSLDEPAKSMTMHRGAIYQHQSEDEQQQQQQLEFQYSNNANNLYVQNELANDILQDQNYAGEEQATSAPSTTNFNCSLDNHHMRR